MVTRAYFIVRAVVADLTDRPGFDHWYGTEHLPDAVARFGARRGGWRCWSRIDPSVHYAFYEFVDLARAQSVLDSPDLRALVAEFDRAWGARVTRTRDIIETAGTIEPKPARERASEACDARARVGATGPGAEAALAAPPVGVET
jgi:hypothetical protein